MDVEALVGDLLIVLAAGFLAGAACKRLGVSLLVGYMVIGAVIGEGGLRLVSQENHELEYLARAGVLLLLFSVGIEFSLDELVRLSRYFLIGGATQMLLVAAPLAVGCLLVGMAWRPALLAAAAAALSSTVLVFKALAEWGQTASPHGRRAIGILLFQDVALVPLMLLVPLFTGKGEPPTAGAYALLAGKSIAFVGGIAAIRPLISRRIVPMLAVMRSVELVTLFTLALLGGACWVAFLLGLPPAIGALAAGLAMSGNRLSKQVDTLVLPYRESFAAVFFVTLGTLLLPSTFLREPFLLTAGLAGMMALKAAAAAVALRLTGLGWKACWGMGLGLCQLGEFSFVLLAEALGQEVLSTVDYSRMLFIATGTLILTPLLLRVGLRWTETEFEESPEHEVRTRVAGRPIQKALVAGMGPIGRQVASQLETTGVDVCLVDLSPINLHAFTQQGFHTVTGDARSPEVLRRADVEHSRLIIICVPDDDVAAQIVRSVREQNRAAPIVVRCRYLANAPVARKAGATIVVSEEAEASGALLKLCDQIVGGQSERPPSRDPQSD